MIAWVSYTLIVSVLVLVAAHATEWMCRLGGRPVRFAWLAAAALVIVIPAAAPARARLVTPRPPASVVDLSALYLTPARIASVDQRVPTAMVWYVIALWAMATLSVSLCLAVTYARLRRARSRWPVADLHGHRVRVAPSGGPLVAGLVRPQVILPRWVLARPPEEQRVIIAHEAAHVAARDPILLAAVCAAVALMPWNPVLWIILGRVRLAVELDCDARVLRGGISPRSYGSLLVDVAESAAPLHFAATALAGNISHLQQRILAMQPRRSSFTILRRTSAAIIALVALLAACEAKIPTSADIDHMDARAAEAGARSLGVAGDSGTIWAVDGAVTTRVAARRIPSDSIVTVNVSKSGAWSRIDIVTKHGASYSVDRPGRVLSRPLILIDGVRSDESALKALPPSRIATVNVMKGAAATKVYGADASGGVILVKTNANGR